MPEQPTTHDYYCSYAHSNHRGSGFGWSIVKLPEPIKTKAHLDRVHQLLSEQAQNVVVIAFQPL